VSSVPPPEPPPAADPAQPAQPPADTPVESQLPDAALPGAGVPDAFGRLWTPHRLAYIQGGGKPTGPGDHEDCPFCIAPRLTDEEGLIVARG
jgi:hypothetical protein